MPFFSMGYEESCLEIGKRDGFPLLGSDVCGAAVIIGVIFFLSAFSVFLSVSW